MLGACSITLPEPAEHELVQEILCARTVARLEGGELGLSEWKLKIAAIRDFKRMTKPVSVFFAAVCHFGRRAKMKPAAGPLAAVLFPQKGERANAL